MVTQEEMEDLYGPLAAHNEHKVGDRIRYKYEGAPTVGTILWVCAPAPDREMHLVYVVLNDERNYPRTLARYGKIRTIDIGARGKLYHKGDIDFY